MRYSVVITGRDDDEKTPYGTTIALSRVVEDHEDLTSALAEMAHGVKVLAERHEETARVLNDDRRHHG